ALQICRYCNSFTFGKKEGQRGLLENPHHHFRRQPLTDELGDGARVREAEVVRAVSHEGADRGRAFALKYADVETRIFVEALSDAVIEGRVIAEGGPIETQGRLFFG